MKARKNKRITIRISETQFERLAEKLKEKSASKSLYIRDLIENELIKIKSI